MKRVMQWLGAGEDLRAAGWAALVLEYMQADWISPVVVQSVLEVARKMLVEHNGEPRQVLVRTCLLACTTCVWLTRWGRVRGCRWDCGYCDTRCGWWTRRPSCPRRGWTGGPSPSCSFS